MVDHSPGLLRDRLAAGELDEDRVALAAALGDPAAVARLLRLPPDAHPDRIVTSFAARAAVMQAVVRDALVPWCLGVGDPLRAG